MEIELLHGLLSGIGSQMLSAKAKTGQKSVKDEIPPPKKDNAQKDVKKKSVDMLARDKYLTDKYRVIRGSVINKPGECRHTGRGDAASDTMESGYSSHRGSQSTSPAPSVCSVSSTELHDEADTRDRVWLICQSGVMPARLVKETKIDDNKETNAIVTIEMEDTQEILTVNKKFIEKAGSHYDISEDLASLEHINESEIVSVLTQRFRDGQYHTWAGKNCTISINPMKKTDLGCSRSALFSHFEDENTDVILQQVEKVYREAVTTLQTQSLILTGRSGAGKTCNFKKALEYLVDTTQNEAEAVFTTEKMYAIDCLLESFCSTRTVLNTHATRMAQLVQLYYDNAGLLIGGELQMALPDTGRILRSDRRPGEPTFPIFYQVHAALGKSSLFLPPRELVSNAFFTPLQDEMEQLTALEDWSRVCVAMEVLGIDQDEEEAFWLVVAAITDLGVMAKQMEESKSYHCDPTIIAKVAEILGVSKEEFQKVITRPATPKTSSPASSLTPSTQASRASSPGLNACYNNVIMPPSVETLSPEGSLMLDNVNRLAVNLYTELLSRLISLINRSIQPYDKHTASIILFDSPGFQNPNSVGDRCSAGFVDLCYNYLHERLQLLFFNSQVDQLTEKEKSLAKLMTSKKTSTSPMVNMIDRASSLEESSSRSSWSSTGTQTLGRRRSSSRRVRFSMAAPGLLTILHKATNCPWSDDRTFVHRLHSHWGGKVDSLAEKCGESDFILKHLQGTNLVKYSASGWRHISYNMGRTNLAVELLKKSEKHILKRDSSDPFNYHGFGCVGEKLTLDEIKAKMSCLQVKVQIDTIVRVLSNTKLNFVVCFQPHHLSGLCELFRKAPGRNISQRLLRDQLRGYQILDYLTFMKEIKNLHQISESRKEALGELATAYSSSFVVAESNNANTEGLATNLWQGLQVAMFSAVTNLDVLEQAVNGIRTGVNTFSMPGLPPPPSMASVLDDTGMLLMQNGKVLLGNIG